MVITTVLIASVTRDMWGWSMPKLVVVITPLLIVDVAFVTANLFKIPAGGWFPLVIGLAGFAVFTTWRTGRRLVGPRIQRKTLSVDAFVEGLAAHPIARHPGTGVYLHSRPGQVPPALLANLRHNESLHEAVVLVSMTTDDRPYVNAAERDRVAHHGLGFHELELRYGFTQQPRLASDLRDLIIDGVSFDPDHTTFFLGRERIAVSARPGMARWREHLFALLSRNASDPSVHFGLPPDRSVDIGLHVDI